MHHNWPPTSPEVFPLGRTVNRPVAGVQPMPIAGRPNWFIVRLPNGSLSDPFYIEPHNPLTGAARP